MGDGPATAKKGVHDWAKKFTGVDPAKPKTPDAPASMAPGGPQAAPASALPAPGSDKQSQEFHAALQKQLTDVDGQLAYTAEHAETAKHQPLAARREAVAAAYQPAVAQVDPNDAAKAKGAIDKVLADAGALSRDVTAFRQAAEKAFNDWQARQPKYDEAVKQAGEMQAWGHAQAPPLQSSLDGIKPHLDSRAYAEACTAFDQAEPQIKPAWEDYQKQKAAQEQYEPARKALDPRLTAAATSRFKTLEAQQQAFGPATQEMDGAASGKDFVKALDLEKSLDANVGEYEKKLADLNQKQQAFDQKWATVKPRLPATPEPGGERILALQQAISTQSGETTAAAEADDYDTALRLANELEPKLTELEAAVAGRKRYDEQWKALKPKLPQSMTGAPPLADLESRIDSSRQQAETAAAADQYEQACTQLTTLESTLAEYETAVAKLKEKKEAYEQARAALEKRLPTSSKAAAGRLAELQTKIEALRAEAEAAAGKSDYDAALKALNEIEGLLTEYEDLASKRDQFEQRWAELKPRVPTASEPDASPNRLKIGEAIGQSRSAIEAVATSGNYEGGLAEIEKLVKLLADLNEAKEKEAQARANFEQAYAALKPNVESALAAKTDIKEIKAKQDDLAAKKKTLDDTVSKNDFEAAQTQIADVQSSLDAYSQEVSKSAVDRDLVRDTANRLKTVITRRYMTSSAKVLNAAAAYDQALDAHKGAIAKVTAAKQLAADIAAGVFFAALGGFAGGAVGAAVGKAGGTVQTAFTNAAAKAGIIDATKDVAKYLTRTAEKLKGKVSDPTAIVAKVGGNGTELARGIGAAVNEQAAKLLETIEQWESSLIEADKANPKGDTVRVNLKEGEPYDSVVNDAFLNVLDGVCGTKSDFAKGLWAAWIQNNAYTLEQACSKSGCRQVVGDNAEGFFAWWGDLTKSIEEQTGKDFGLRARLDEAKKVVQEEANERNAHGGQTHDPPL